VEPFAAKDFIAIYAAIVATLVAAWNIGKEVVDRREKRRERTRLRVDLTYKRVLSHRTFTRFDVFPSQVSNLGRDKVIIQKVLARGNGLEFCPGEHEEPGAAFGSFKRALPRKLEPGETVELDLFTVALFSAAIDEIVVIDNEGNEFKVSEEALARARNTAASLVAKRAPAA
jgi:hypothetical protein